MKKNGFTILEIVLAISILTTTIGASYILIQQTLVAASISQSKLIAYYLGQEGIEIIRNIRDNNWLLQRENPTISWKEGLEAGNWEAGYNDLSLNSYSDRYLYIEGATGFYDYIDSPAQGDLKTMFKRKILITEIESGILEVKSIVDWSERGRNHSIEVVDRLYDWYGY